MGRKIRRGLQWFESDSGKRWRPITQRGWQLQPESRITYITLNGSSQALCLSCPLSQCSNGYDRFCEPHSGPCLFSMLEAPPEGDSSFSGPSILNYLLPQNAISPQGAAGCHPNSRSPYRPPNLLLEPSQCFLCSACSSLPKALQVSRKPQGEMLWWFILACFTAAQCSVAETCKLPVLIMFAYRCLSVVPVCFYSHPSAQLRIVVLSWESLCSGVGLWFGHHLDSRQGEKSKKDAWFTEHYKGCCGG